MVYNFILQSVMDHVVTLWQSKSSHLISYQNLALTVGHIGYNRQPIGWFLTVDMVPGLRVVAHWMASGRRHGSSPKGLCTLDGFWQGTWSLLVQILFSIMGKVF